MRHAFRLISVVLVAGALDAPARSLFAQQSELAVSPFVSFLPSAGSSPLAGLALTIGGSGAFALRGSAHLALENSNNNTTTNTRTIRPWGADADVLLLFGRGTPGLYARTITPFAFAGLGTETEQINGFNTTTHNWSYGAGAAVPISNSVDLFGEGRWRMSRYVLPTSTGAPSPTSELRFGVSFHVGSDGNDGRRSRGRRIEVSF